MTKSGKGKNHTVLQYNYILITIKKYLFTLEFLYDIITVRYAVIFMRLMVKRRNKERFFEELFGRMRRSLMIYTSCRITDKDFAEDIVCETFKYVWLRIDEAVKLDNPEAWVVGILKNCIKKHYSAMKKDNELYDSEPLSENLMSPERFYENDLDLELTPNEFEIVKLKEMGYKHSEIAEMTGQAPGTIASKVSRIKTKLSKNDKN
jgi:DNA-directed RNA polymerase specialized sigma24 family protein